MIRYYLTLMLCLLFLSCGSGGGADGGNTDGTDTSAKGSVAEWSGLTINNGVECISQDASPLSGTMIYVSPTGSDNNSGASPTNALKTITKAVCNAAPGQTIKVLGGIYTESVILYSFGSDAAPITVSGDQENRPTMDGGNRLTMGIAISESKNIVIENMKFENFTDEGVLVQLSSDFRISNSEFIGNGRASIEPDYLGEGFGINVTDASSVTIENSMFFENGPNPSRRAQNIMGTGINTFAITDAVIRNNTSSRNIGGGILVEDGANVVVENNLIEANDLDVSADGWWDAGIWIDGGVNITARNNTIRDNLGPAIEVSDEDRQYPALSKGYIVENNTLSGNYFALYTFNYGVCQLPTADILAWRGNAISGNVYSGVITEDWEYDAAGQTMCSRWPCGENLACE